MPQADFDRFAHSADSPASPARQAFMVAKHDTTALQHPKALLIGVSGTLTVRAVDSPADITVTVAAGQIVPIRASHVRATGTSAAEIVGLA